MKSLTTITAVLTAVIIPTLAVTITSTSTSEENIIFTTQAASPDPDSGSLCPDSNGKNITDNAGVRYGVSCDWIMVAMGQEEVGGSTSPLICMEACDEAEECYGVNMLLDGGCTLISGEQSALKAAKGSLNLVRLAEAASTTSRVQITKTVFVDGQSTSTLAPTSTKKSSQTATASATPSVCDLRGTDLCPQCDNTIATSDSGIAYTIFCDSELYSNGTYSVQEWLSPAGCLAQCDQLDFCEGAFYYDERNCELAKGQNVFPIGHEGYTAFLPVYTGKPVAVPSEPIAFPTATPGGGQFNTTSAATTASAAEPTFSILPVDSGCNASALTCPECDGVPVVDGVNATYTVMCDFAPVCNSLSNSDAASSQEECMQDCDQDATCLAVLFFPGTQSCTLCKQGIEGAPGQDLDYIVLAADIDGDDDPETPMTTSSPTFTRPTTGTVWSGYTANSTRGPATAPSYSFTSGRPTSTFRSITDLPTPFDATTSTASTSSVLLPAGPAIPIANTTSGSISASTTSTEDLSTITGAASVPTLPANATLCPALAEGVYVDPTDFGFYKVLCDSILTAAASRYTSASDLSACVAACTGECDGVQFGYTTRCGLYTDISFYGPGEGWTAAVSVGDSASTELPFPTPAAATTTTSMLVSTSSLASNGTVTRASASPIMTPTGLKGY